MTRPSLKYVVAGFDKPLVYSATEDTASNLRWRSFSPYWWEVVQALIAGLDREYVWQNYSETVQDKILELMLPEDPTAECPDCPDCPEPPPPPPQPQPGGGAAAVGRLGMTLEELEDFVMGWSLRGQIAYVNGVLCYWSEGCCDWVPVEVVSGEAPPSLTPSGLSAVASGLQSLADWTAAGKPNTDATKPPVPSSNPYYTTSDSLACAKASAFVAAIRQMLIDVREGINTSGDSFTALINGIAVAGGWLAGDTPFSWVPNLTAAIWSGWVETSAEDSIADINTVLDDNIAWADIICQSVAKMQPTITIGILLMNRATDADYKAVVDTIKANITLPGKVAQILDTFPMSVIENDVTIGLSDQECDCDQYLPNGYLPQLNGMTTWQAMVKGGGVGANVWEATGQTNLNDIDMTPVGTKLAQNSFRTAYQGETYEGQSIYYYGFGALFVKAVGVVIDSMKIDTALVGSFSECKSQLDYFLPGTGWVTSVNGTVFTADQADFTVFSGGNIVPEDATHFRIQAKGRGTTGTGQSVTWSDMKITGNSSGVGFVDTALGT